MDLFANFEPKGVLKSDQEEYQHPQEENPKDVLEEPDKKPNLGIIYVITFMTSLVLIFRLLDLQVTQGAKNQYLAEGNRLRSRDILAPRGNIYDIHNQVLAKNQPSYSLEIYPADLPKEKSEREKIYQIIKLNSQIPIDELREKIEKVGLFSLEPIVLKENLERNEAQLLEIRYKDISGLVVAKQPIRDYLENEGLSQILGYIGKISQEELDSNSNYKITDYYGKSGLELTYEKSLKGKNGKEQMEVDSLGRIQRLLATQDPKAGSNLISHLDLNLQKEIVKDTKEVLDSIDKNKAVVIAINPQTGGILALVNFPSFNNNIFSQSDFSDNYQKLLDDPLQPMFNRAISGTYPSGSTIKPMMAAAGLEEKVISEHTRLDTSAGEIKIGQWTFPDWKVHGVTDVRQAIAESNDIFFYALGGGWDRISGLGINRIDDYLEKFGFGQISQIDLPAEAKGLVPSPSWKKKVKNESWYIGDTYHLSIGQGDFLTTPLQLLNATAAIANGGELLKPQLVAYETDQNGNTVKTFEKVVIRSNFVNSNNLKIVREGMRQSVTSGSASQLQNLPVEAAAKTGTAQFGPLVDGKYQQAHAWVTAFAPYNDPQIAIIVLVEGGQDSYSVANPIAQKILEYYFTRNK